MRSAGTLTDAGPASATRRGVTTRAAVFHGPGDVRVEHRLLPPLEPTDVLIRVRSTGVCGSDLHYFRGQDPWGSIAFPTTSGHEIAGNVEAVGDAVTDLAVGELVAVKPMFVVGCGRCPQCERGRSQICPSRGLDCGREMRPAGFADLDVAPRRAVYRAEGATADQACLADVYACALHARRRADVRPEYVVAVIGTGPIGMALGQVALASGCSQVLLIGRRADAARQAIGLGAATDVIATEDVDDVVAAAREVIDGEGADVVFEAVGGEAGTVGLAAEIATTGGKVCVLGAFTADVAVDHVLCNTRALDILFCSGHGGGEGEHSEFAQALAAIAAGPFEAARMITHHYELADIGAAMRALERRSETGALKVVIHP